VTKYTCNVQNTSVYSLEGILVMITPADMIGELVLDATAAPPGSIPTFRPSSTQTFDFQGRPNDSDSDND